MTPRSEPKQSSERIVHWLLLLLAVALSVVVARRGASGALGHASVGARVDPISIVPAGPELLLSADVAALAEVAGPELLAAGGGKLLGLQQVCGFEPLLGLRRVALALPPRVPAEPSSDFAFIAETALEPEAMLGCASAVIAQRGGAPVRSRLGQFWSVRDQKKPAGEVAVRSDGLFVLSGGRYLRDVIDTAEGSAVSDDAARLRSELHAAMRRKLGSAELVLTLLPGGLLEFPELQAAGVALRFGKDVQLRGFVGCATAAACTDAASLLEEAKGALSREPGLAWLASLAVTRREAQLDLSARLERAQLGPLLNALTGP